MEELTNGTTGVESRLPEYLKMYEVSGQDPIGEHDFSRYKKAKEDNDANIEFIIGKNKERELSSLASLAQNILCVPKNERAFIIRKDLSNPNPEVQRKSAQMISYAAENEIDSLREIVTQKVREGLANSDPEVQKRSAELIWCALENERAFLIEEGLVHPNIKVQKIAAQMISSVSGKERAILIEKGLIHFNLDVQIASAGMILCAPKNERAPLIRKGLSNPNPEVQKIAAQMISYVFENEKIYLIKECLVHSNPEVQKIAAQMINHVSESEIDSLREIITQKVREGLANSDPEVQKRSARLINCVLENERVFLIRKGLANPNPEVQKISAGMIRCVSKDEIAFLVKEGLKHFNLDVQKIVADMVWHVPENEIDLLREIVTQKVREGLANPDPEVQKIAAGMIRHSSEGEIASLIREGLVHFNQEVKNISAGMIMCVSKNERYGIVTWAIQRGLGEYLIQPPLYKKGDITKEKFSRANFYKTGSITILIGGDLKDKTIIREIKPEAFLAWQKIYENWELWRQAGFDYVPIEPIQSFSLNKDGLVRVYSGVLDLNLADWGKITSRFKFELEMQKSKIENILKNKGFNHGHIHDWNFCLRFFRDTTNGKPDFGRVPRLYLIDFDKAVFIEK